MKTFTFDDLIQLERARYAAERAIKNWIELHPEETDALDTIALEYLSSAKDLINKE